MSPALRSWGPTRAGPLPPEAERRCQGASGGWCTPFLAQAPIPAVPPPAGDRTCSMDCNFVGSCSALTGLCQCPAGEAGEERAAAAGSSGRQQRQAAAAEAAAASSYCTLTHPSLLRPAGWTGLGCTEVRNRPCTHTYHTDGWVTDGPKANISAGERAERAAR